MSHKNADTVVVLDFETTGLSPNMGDRAIEIGAVLIEHGRITDRFQQLMNPGFLINGFISSYTGISNAMLKSAPDCLSVTREFASFVGKHNLVAHTHRLTKSFWIMRWCWQALHIPVPLPAQCWQRGDYTRTLPTINWEHWCDISDYRLMVFFTGHWPMQK